MLKTKPIKQKKCKVCKGLFDPFNTIQPTCSVTCALIKAVADREKKEKRAARNQLEKLKTRSDHLKDAQNAVNAYIRERDRGLPCISCGGIFGERIVKGKYYYRKINAGHYRSVGAAPHLRYTEDNINNQCVQCNKDKSGNSVEYRIGLVKKIGVARVEALENNNTPMFWTVEQIMRIKTEYRAKLRELKRSRGLGK